MNGWMEQERANGRGLEAWAIHVNVKPANQSTANLKISQSQLPPGTVGYKTFA